MKHIRILCSSLITGLCLSVVSASNSGFTVTSPAFVQGKSIAKEHTCDGIGSSLPLKFGTPPAGTKSFAILLWDDDAPAGLASQWIVYDMPLKLTGLEAGVKDGANVQGFKQGENTFGKLGYEKARTGTNGFNCLVNRDGIQNGDNALHPTCWDPEGSRTILPVMLRVGELLAQQKSAAEIKRDIDEGFAQGRFHSPSKAGIAYMLAGDVINAEVVYMI